MSENEVVQKHLKIKGRVQGVGFRHFTRQAARSLEIKGWVKNMPDGTVETVISGSRENIEAMMAQLEKGPISARVSDVIELSDKESDENKFNNFTVRR